MPLISIVVPCYNEQESLPIFLKELDGVVRIMTQQDPGISFETVLIDDGSADKTLAVMKAEAAAAHPYAIRWHSFSRNFGKEAALLAGLQHAKGDYVATMDADMQDPPSLLPQMYEILQTEDYDNVATRRTTRKGEPPIRSFCARMFYKIINRISKADIVDGARDFRLMKRPMVNAIISMGEYNRFSKGIYGWVGFKTKWLPYVNVNRVAGETKWSFLVAAPLFHRRHRRVFHGTALPRRPHRYRLLSHRYSGIRRHPSKDACLGRPRRRMAVARLPHNAVWRHAASVLRNHR